MKKILALLSALSASPAAAQQPVVQSGFVTPGHGVNWITNGVVGDSGAPSGGVGLLGSFVINDMLCSNATGTSISIIDCGFSATGINNWVGIQNLNGGGTSTTPAANDNTTKIATTAFVQSALSGSIIATQYYFIIGNASNVGVPTALAGDCLYGSGGIICTKTNNVAFAASATTDTTNASNISSGTIGAARLPLATSAAFGAVKGDGSTLPITAGTIACATATSSQLGCVEPDGTTLVNSAGAISVRSLPTPQGRLTLQSAAPVMTSTQSAQTTVYYAPYVGGIVPIYNGTAFGAYQFTSGASDNVGLSLALGSNWAANAAFDVFVTLGGGSSAELCTVAWTNTTTRATTLAIYNGLLTNSASATCRTTNSATITLGANQGTYLGSFYTNGSTGTVDYIYGASASGGTAASFGIWNYYNRVVIATNVTDSGTGYSYGTATIRQARASAGNQVKFIAGVAEDGVAAALTMQATTAATATTTGNWGIGCNSTSTFTGQPAQIYAVSAAANSLAMAAVATCPPAVGVFTVSANETGDGTHAVTFDSGSLNTLAVQLRM